MLGLGSPDKVPPLTEKAAIELGGDLLAEFFVFGTAAGAILLEYLRQSTNKEKKDNALAQTVADLEEDQKNLIKKLETNNERIMELTKYVQDQKTKMDEMNARITKLNAKANVKHATQGAQTTGGTQIGKVMNARATGKKPSEDVTNSILYQTADDTAKKLFFFEMLRGVINSASGKVEQTPLPPTPASTSTTAMPTKSSSNKANVSKTSPTSAASKSTANGKQTPHPSSNASSASASTKSSK
jgi:hypothetical protein